MRTLSHDGFARTVSVRFTIATQEACSECGNKRIDGKLYQYGTQPDDSLSGRVAIHRGLFCCKPCHNAYHS